MATVPGAAEAEARAHRLDIASAVVGAVSLGITAATGFSLLATTPDKDHTTLFVALVSALPVSAGPTLLLAMSRDRAHQKAFDLYNAAARDSGQCPP